MNKLILTLLFSGLLIITACGDQSPDEADGEVSPSEVESEIPELQMLNMQIRENPENAELYFNRAIINEALRKDIEAIQDLEQAIALNPQAAHYYMRLSDIYLKDLPQANFPDSKKAIALLEDFLEENPENSAVHIHLAETLMYVEQYDRANAHADIAIKQKPYNPEAYFLKGVADKLSGDTVSAITNYQHTVEQEPEHFDAHYELGLLLSLKNNSLAADYFNNALRIDPGNQEVLYALGLHYQNMGQYREAKQTYRRIINQDPQYERAFYNLGYIYFHQDSLQKAHSNFNLAVKMKPDYSDAYYMRGLMSEEMGNDEDALRDYNQALNIYPEHELANLGLDRLRH